jgi:hypothetical protein
MEELQLEHTSEQWRLLIDASKVNLEIVLLYKGNKFSFITLADALHLKETYENFQVLLQRMRCEEHRWNVFADLKFVAMLTVLQAGYTKFCCF